MNSLFYITDVMCSFSKKKALERIWQQFSKKKTEDNHLKHFMQLLATQRKMTMKTRTRKTHKLQFNVYQTKHKESNHH